TAPTLAPAQPTHIPPTPTAVANNGGPVIANTQAAATSIPLATEALPTATPETSVASAASTQPLVADIARGATEFLASLDDNQRTKATYAFGDAERTRWHWTTPRNVPRNGLPLREMSQSQRDLALALMRASVSEGGFQKALDIISLQNDLGNDPELYYVTVFGAPGGAEPWGWRFEGHHLSRHYTITGDQLAVTPFFLGSWPTVSNAGLKAMEREEWAARELITSLEGGQRQTALFQERTLSRHVTQNQAYVTPLDPVGLPAGELNDHQQTLMLEIIQTYLGTLPEGLAASHFIRLSEMGLAAIQFGWAGSLEARRPHYYRLQGPTFLLEHDNSRNGGTHIHSVWRDFAEDFGQNLASTG
ncbi:MAG: DUF3500 domain-containing protein, partial [Anaerolineales bacterium]